MYTLENTMLKKAIFGLSIAAISVLSTGCSGENGVKTSDTTAKATESKRAVDGGMKYETKDGKYTAYHVNTQDTKGFTKGRTPTPTEIAAWNIDVMPDGTGLPEYDMEHGKPVLDENGKPKKAQGSVEWGNELYDEKCSMCHGDFGAGGVGGYPALSGGDIKSLTNQLQDPADPNPGQEPPSRKIGSYWPYASTLFWYIKDAMPFPHPKSLSNSEVYAISAYLLMENGVTVGGEEMDEEFVMDKEKYKTIIMPNKDGFYPQVDTPEDPKKGVENMTKYLSNPKNYGTGTRCMSDCIKGEVPVLRIKNELTSFNQPLTTVRDLPKVENKGPEHPGKALYDANGCAGCHANAAIGAPVVGNAENWKAVTEKGMDAVYKNGINGINAMPPKGGTALSDDDFKLIVDYMVDASK